MARVLSRASRRKGKGFKELAVLVLAAGRGKRMRSALPKVMHPLHGRPVLSYVLDLARPLGDLFVVVGAPANRVREILPKGFFPILQKKPLGTGHAVMAAAPKLKRYRNVLILSGDTPLLQGPTLRMLLDEHKRMNAASTLLSDESGDRMGSDYPILEYDGAAEALIEPSMVVKPIDIPEHCILPIFHTVIANLTATSRLVHLADIRTAMGPLPVFTMDHGGTAVAVAHPGVSAPLVAAVMEELIALLRKAGLPD